LASEPIGYDQLLFILFIFVVSYNSFLFFDSFFRGVTFSQPLKGLSLFGMNGQQPQQNNNPFLQPQPQPEAQPQFPFPPQQHQVVQQQFGILQQQLQQQQQLAGFPFLQQLGSVASSNPGKSVANDFGLSPEQCQSAWKELLERTRNVPLPTSATFSNSKPKGATNAVRAEFDLLGKFLPIGRILLQLYVASSTNNLAPGDLAQACLVTGIHLLELVQQRQKELFVETRFPDASDNFKSFSSDSGHNLSPADLQRLSAALQLSSISSPSSSSSSSRGNQRNRNGNYSNNNQGGNYPRNGDGGNPFRVYSNRQNGNSSNSGNHGNNNNNNNNNNNRHFNGSNSNKNGSGFGSTTFQSQDDQ
jgi:hypothetical protein